MESKRIFKMAIEPKTAAPPTATGGPNLSLSRCIFPLKLNCSPRTRVAVYTLRGWMQKKKEKKKEKKKKKYTVV